MNTHTSSPSQTTAKVQKRMKRNNHLLGIIIALAAICIFFTAVSRFFFTGHNILNILLQVSVISIAAFGMTFVLMIGQIDLSVGSIIAVSGMVFALVLNKTDSLIAALVAVVLVGVVCGTINGTLFSYFGIPSFIVTVATMGIFRGVGYAFTDAKPVRIEHEASIALANGSLLGIPIPIYIMFGVLIISHILLTQTRFGRHTKMIGGNPEAARYAGIKIGFVSICVFIIVGVFSAVSGSLLASRLYSAQPNAALGYELDAIAATVLGGTSLTGGYGSVIGTFFGALIIGVVNNGMNLLGISYYYQLIIKGCIILLAVYIDIRNKKRITGA